MISPQAARALLHGVGCAFIGAACFAAAPANVPDDSPSTLADRGASETQGPQEVFVANDDWLPLAWEPMKIAKGSALDFSHFLDRPAGKWGEIVSKEGRFQFKNAPEKQVRFYGTNVTHGLPFLDKERCEQLADYLAASGYNLVRFHNYTYSKRVMKEVGSTEFNPEARDQLDYLFFCLKERGIYYTFPLYSWGAFKAGDVGDVPEFRDKALRFQFRGLLPLSNDALNWLKAFSLNLLTHKNPYTGLALKDDPALIGVELANENPLLMVMKNNTELLPVYRRTSRKKLAAALGREPTEAELIEFIPKYAFQLQDEFIATMRTFLRGSGIEKPITDVSVVNNMAYAMPRSKLDYVDIHQYWALYKKLPGAATDGRNRFPYRQSWVNPNTVSWQPSLNRVAARIVGLPFINGEFNSCYPTPYWAFTGPMEATLAGLQGWSGVVRYAQAAQPKDAFAGGPLNRIESGLSPTIMFSERIGAVLFAQGEVTPLPVKVPLVLTPEYLKSKLDMGGGPGYPPKYRDLAFQYQLGTLVSSGAENYSEFPTLVVPADMPIPENLKKRNVIKADDDLAKRLKTNFEGCPTTSPLQMDTAAGTARIITPRSETFLLPAGADRASGGLVSVSGNQTVSVTFAASLDARPLAKADRMLVLYLTDLKNAGTVVEHEGNDSVILRDYGELPLLMRQGKVEMSFRMAGRPLPKVWALKYDGTRAQEITPRASADGFSFAVSAFTDPKVFSAYEVAWTP